MDHRAEEKECFVLTKPGFDTAEIVMLTPECDPSSSLVVTFLFNSISASR